MKRKLISRRSVLRGVLGSSMISLALPPLEAMLTKHEVYADEPANTPFFGLFYWANGTPWHIGHGAEQGIAGHPDLWTPAQQGENYNPSPLLSPLSNHSISVLTGLEPYTQILPQPPGQGDGHMRGFMVAMTGDRPQPETFNHSSHTLTALRPSLDQYVANHPDFYGEEVTPFKSLEVGVSEARFHTYGHWNAISYNGPNSINLPLMTPSVLYDRLFSVTSGLGADMDQSLRRIRVLDSVLEDARQLQSRLGSADRARLEAHIEHLYSLQRRITVNEVTCELPDRPNDQGSLLDRTRAQAELIALAVNCGLTRVFSFMLTSPASTHIFSNLNVPDGMHKTCHDGHWERVRAITEHQMEAFAVFLDAFNTPDPLGQTLLSKGLIYATSEYGEGWKHSVKELPILLAGGAHGRIKQGYHLRSPGGNLCQAQLTALHALGLTDESFGWNGAEISTPFNELLL